MAVDTVVDTILILGDFNKDQRNRKKSKIADILIKYDMIHLTNDATDVSESSSLVIYLDISNNPNNVDHIHVGEPFVPKISLSYLKMCSLHDIAEILLKFVLSINQSINQSINIFTEYWKSKMLHIHVSRGKFCFTTVEIMLNFVNNYKM